MKQLNPTTYELEIENEKIEIGKKDSPDFLPYVKLKRWGEECSIDVGFKTTVKKAPVVEDDKVKWKDQDLECHFYDKDGSFELETVLKKRPTSNKLEFFIDSDNLDFTYQPPLTQEEIGEGDIRPDNIVGSYAVYHKTKGGTHRGQSQAEKYKCGKAFHIYRPEAADNTGAKTWCSLSIDGGTLTVEIPQDFLDNATYPVIIDPTFGYETAGGSWATIENTIRGSKWAISEDGNAGKLTVYMSALQHNVKAAIYDNASNLVAGTNEELIDVTGGSWFDFIYSVPQSLTASAEYYLVVWSQRTSGGSLVTYDAGTGYRDSQTYGSWPDPANFNSDSRKYSIYCTYEPDDLGASSGSAVVGARYGKKIYTLRLGVESGTGQFKLSESALDGDDIATGDTIYLGASDYHEETLEIDLINTPSNGYVSTVGVSLYDHYSSEYVVVDGKIDLVAPSLSIYRDAGGGAANWQVVVDGTTLYLKADGGNEFTYTLSDPADFDALVTLINDEGGSNWTSAVLTGWGSDDPENLAVQSYLQGTNFGSSYKTWLHRSDLAGQVSQKTVVGGDWSVVAHASANGGGYLRWDSIAQNDICELPNLPEGHLFSVYATKDNSSGEGPKGDTEVLLDGTTKIWGNSVFSGYFSPKMCAASYATAQTYYQEHYFTVNRESYTTTTIGIKVSTASFTRMQLDYAQVGVGRPPYDIMEPEDALEMWADFWYPLVRSDDASGNIDTHMLSGSDMPSRTVIGLYAAYKQLGSASNRDNYMNALVRAVDLYKTQLATDDVSYYVAYGGTQKIYANWTFYFMYLLDYLGQETYTGTNNLSEAKIAEYESLSYDLCDALAPAAGAPAWEYNALDDYHADWSFLGVEHCDPEASWALSDQSPNSHSGDILYNSVNGGSTATDGEYIQFRFYGTQFTLTETVHTNIGIHRIYIDGTPITDGDTALEEDGGDDKSGVDGYGATAYQQDTYTKTGLSEDYHTVKIEMTNEKNALSVGYYINFDRVSGLDSTYMGYHSLDTSDIEEPRTWLTNSWHYVLSQFAKILYRVGTRESVQNYLDYANRLRRALRCSINLDYSVSTSIDTAGKSAQHYHMYICTEYTLCAAEFGDSDMLDEAVEMYKYGDAQQGDDDNLFNGTSYPYKTHLDGWCTQLSSGTIDDRSYYSQSLANGFIGFFYLYLQDKITLTDFDFDKTYLQTFFRQFDPINNKAWRMKISFGQEIDFMYGIAWFAFYELGLFDIVFSSGKNDYLYNDTVQGKMRAICDSRTDFLSLCARNNVTTNNSSQQNYANGHIISAPLSSGNGLRIYNSGGASYVKKLFSSEGEMSVWQYVDDASLSANANVQTWTKNDGDATNSIILLYGATSVSDWVVWDSNKNGGAGEIDTDIDLIVGWWKITIDGDNDKYVFQDPYGRVTDFEASVANGFTGTTIGVTNGIDEVRLYSAHVDQDGWLDDFKCGSFEDDFQDNHDDWIPSGSGHDIDSTYNHSMETDSWFVRKFGGAIQLDANAADTSDFIKPSGWNDPTFTFADAGVLCTVATSPLQNASNAKTLNVTWSGATRVSNGDTLVINSEAVTVDSYTGDVITLSARASQGSTMDAHNIGDNICEYPSSFGAIAGISPNTFVFLKCDMSAATWGGDTYEINEFFITNLIAKAIMTPWGKYW